MATAAVMKRQEAEQYVRKLTDESTNEKIKEIS